MLFKHQGQLDNARIDLKTLLENNPDDFKAKANMASISIAEGKYQQALTEYEKNIK